MCLLNVAVKEVWKSAPISDEILKFSDLLFMQHPEVLCEVACKWRWLTRKCRYGMEGEVCMASRRRNVDLGRAATTSDSVHEFAWWTCNISLMVPVLSPASLTKQIPILYRVGQKIGTIFFLYALTLSSINRFSKLFHSQNQEKICNNTAAKDPTTPQVCCYTTLWNDSVIKATTKNNTTSVSVTTHFKKFTTGNNVFIVSVIV